MGQVFSLDEARAKAQEKSRRLTGTEVCIIPNCRVDTGIPRMCDVDDPRRMGNFMKGHGQLCSSCARKILGETRVFLYRRDRKPYESRHEPCERLFHIG